ncbi:MAG: SpoVA/SpoVAEb family sporulation membrane protein [Oscillospiraceae bacterium]|nr:SpoVA/SpoVAEb family sporulation membrane protein [Oscillospiraceae bacterium]
MCCKYFRKIMSPKLTHVEGLILGIGVKMFSIAGPVIVYGTIASVVYGVLFLLFA